MRKALAVLLPLEVIVLVIAIAVFLAGENDTVEQPASVEVSPSLTKPLKVSVPVSVNLETVGAVKTAALTKRGGHAVPTTSVRAHAGKPRGSSGLAGGDTGVVDSSQRAPHP